MSANLAHSGAHTPKSVSPAATRTEMTWIVMLAENDR